MNVYQKLQKCRVELQAKNLKKSGLNKFAGFNYYELADFIPTINQMFNENGLFSDFSILGDTATLLIIDSEKPEDTITFTSPIADANLKGCTPVQSLGGVHTYLKRYLYLNALEIVESDVLDASVKKEESAAKYPPAPKKEEVDYRLKLIMYCEKNGVNMNEIAKLHKLNAKSSQEDFKLALGSLGVN